MKRAAITVAVLVLVGAFIVLASGASSGSSGSTYKIELDNAFGLVSGEDFKVAGVVAGSIQSISLDQKTLHAVVTVNITQSGFGQFRKDVFCESRPQSLIGEYYINCDPGTSSQVLPPGSTIPVTHTQSTIPADLLDDIMRLPYRQRLTLLVNELGAGVAGNSSNLQAALDRAVPALTETDNLLHLLASDSSTLQDLTASSNAVITALAHNSTQVQRFIVEANNAAGDTATQDANLRSTFQQLPGFLEQLRPALAKLSVATTANQPVLANLNTASGELDRLFTDLPGFSHAALPAIKSLGQASVTGRSAAIAARPTIAALNQFSKPTPELAQNLAIVLADLDTQSRAVERDPRSPGGKGFSGLQALLGYVFNQTLAINAYGPYGHMLAVDAFVDSKCTPYATPSTVASGLKQDGAAFRKCYSWLGPNQPGVNETDPSDPSAAVPDPGGAPPGEPGPNTNARRLLAASDSKHHGARKHHGSAGKNSKSVGSVLGSLGGGNSGSSSSGSGSGSGGSSNGLPSLPVGGQTTTTTTSSSPPPPNRAAQLLNYLLGP